MATAGKLKIVRGHFAVLAVRELEEMRLKNDMSNTDQRIEELMNALISWYEMRMALKWCKSNKTTETDGIPGEVYNIVQADEGGTSNLSRAMLNGDN